MRGVLQVVRFINVSFSSVCISSFLCSAEINCCSRIFCATLGELSLFNLFLMHCPVYIIDLTLGAVNSVVAKLTTVRISDILPFVSLTSIRRISLQVIRRFVANFCASKL